MAKILIFTSHGGGGHISASNAITEYLKEDHEVVVFPFFTEVLRPLDLVQFFTGRKYNVESGYNYFLRKKWMSAVNGMCHFALFVLPILKYVVHHLLSKFLTKEKPDLIISVIPLVNNYICDVARKLGIPFLLIPTDLDCSTFINKLRIYPTDKFLLGLAFDHPDILQLVQQVSIPANKIIVSGFPLRQQFFETKNIESLKASLNIPQGKPVLFVLMGAVGSQALYMYVQELREITIPFHVIVCLGRNEALREKIAAVSLPSHITLSIISFTEKIADLMAVSDICMTKAGSVSVAEALYMNLPIILDGTSKSLIWENFNLYFIQHNNFGDTIVEKNQIRPVVQKYLRDQNYRALIKKFNGI